MYPEQTDKAFIIRSGVLIFLIMVMVFASIIILDKKSQPTNFVTQDTSGGGKITPIVSADPEYINFDSLIDKGLSTDQATGIKYGFSQYNKSLPASVKTVTVDTESIRSAPRDRNNPSANSIVSFNVNLDDKTDRARVEFNGLSDVWLYLYDESGTALYESGLININSQSPN
jgi:hypothetical protein